MAGTYQPGVPDPTDTTSDTAPVGSTLTDFDDLTMFGVSPNLANLQVLWKRGTKTPIMADTPGGEVPALKSDATGVHPRIEDSNEFQTFERLSQSLYRDLGPDQIGDLQLRMIAGGFYGKNPDYIAKSPDKKTYGVWQDVLKQAMRSGKTPDEVLDEAIQANGGLEEGLSRFGVSRQGTLADIPLTHPDDIRMVAKEVSRRVLGKGWGEDQLAKFVQSYQSMETQEGRAAQGSGATVQKAPSLEGAVEAEARRQNPVAAGATDWDGAAQMMLKAFQTLGGSSQ